MYPKFHSELNRFDNDVLDKADVEYAKEYGCFEDNERSDEHKARSDYYQIAKRLQRIKDITKG